MWWVSELRAYGAQIGAVLGKGGSAIATLRSETGCIIRVAPLDGPIPEGVSVPGLGPKSGTADQGRGDQGRNGVEVLSIEGRHSCVAAAAKAAAQQLKQWQVGAVSSSSVTLIWCPGAVRWRVFRPHAWTCVLQGNERSQWHGHNRVESRLMCK